MKQIITYLLSSFAALFILLFCITNYDIQQVSGQSMNPTFEDGDIILVHIRTMPQDRDIVILTTSYIENYAVEGEHIIKRYYADYSTNGLFVLGDNSEISYDSRYYGEAPMKSLEGVVVCNLSEIFR